MAILEAGQVVGRLSPVTGNEVTASQRLPFIPICCIYIDEHRLWSGYVSDLSACKTSPLSHARSLV
nr:hypothetical protein Iba_scaffold32290CG0020 [Ipomoea batatas]GMC79474.1 hypothetical protein Iba_chr04aCG11160 [Ipomoea batatas]GMC82085.1 hypothetical protein Iba_chr04bCG10090 [Ipomoea batatas]GME14269.1 hypothetical protein Iba_scaffold15124CG0090 [Ipomoea batatas]